MKQRPSSGRHTGGSATQRPVNAYGLILVALAGIAAGATPARAQDSAVHPAANAVQPSPGATGNPVASGATSQTAPAVTPSETAAKTPAEVGANTAAGPGVVGAAASAVAGAVAGGTANAASSNAAPASGGAPTGGADPAEPSISAAMPAPIMAHDVNTGDSPELGAMPVVIAAAPNKPAPPAPDQGEHLGGLIDREVLGPDHGSVGRIIDVLVGPKGNVDAVVVDVGGFMGVGNRRVAIAWSLFALNPTDFKGPVDVKLPAQQIRSAPAYDPAAATVVVVRAPQPAAPAKKDDAAVPDSANEMPGAASQKPNPVPVVAPATSITPPAHHQGIDQGEASPTEPVSGESSLADQGAGSSDTQPVVQHQEAGPAERFAPRPNAE